jgi:cytochrome P450
MALPIGPLPALLAPPASGPVVRVPAPTGDEVWLVRDHRLARLVLTDPRFSRAGAVRPEAPKVNTVNPARSSMMSMDGAEHARLRRLVAGAFAPRRIAALVPDIEQLIDSLLVDVSTMDRPVDLIAAFASPLPIAVISSLLGVPAEDRTLVQEWAGVLFDVTASTPREKARRGFALFAYMAKLIRRSRAMPSEDLLGDLIAAHDAGALTEPELIDLALAILTAGYETTVGQLGLSVLSLLCDDEARAALGRGTEGIVEEYLRLTPATPMSFSRLATEDVRLGEVLVEAGQAVVVSLLHANRDGSVFAEPDRLDPARHAGSHLTFGRGAHFCLGAGLARLQLNLAIRALFERMPELRLADVPEPFGWYEGLATRGLTHLLVTW